MLAELVEWVKYLWWKIRYGKDVVLWRDEQGRRIAGIVVTPENMHKYK